MKKTALIALLMAPGLISQVCADELGRLFFTPEERQQLDQQHARHAAGKDEAAPQPFITVNGVIQHGDGSRTAWINGKAQHNAPGKTPNTVSVTMPGKSESIEVKVGQRLLLDNLPLPKTETPAPSNNSN